MASQMLHLPMPKINDRFWDMFYYPVKAQLSGDQRNKPLLLCLHRGQVCSVSRSGCATGKKTRTRLDCNWLQLDQWSSFFIFLIKQLQATGLFHWLLTGCNRFVMANRFSIKIPTKLAQSLENWMKIE
jgi:hypothetical protein